MKGRRLSYRRLGTVARKGGRRIRIDQPLYPRLRGRFSQSERNLTNDLMGGVTPCKSMAAESSEKQDCHQNAAHIEGSFFRVDRRCYALRRIVMI